eukprot:GFKZ01009691.1.p4 GENE.GFKZ01009691.1~~GFKZ01009691.1.p4  ORF type:complete len:119 (+),score=7.40 GFKZ01009691.1:1113-1469(+)
MKEAHLVRVWGRVRFEAAKSVKNGFLRGAHLQGDCGSEGRHRRRRCRVQGAEAGKNRAVLDIGDAELIECVNRTAVLSASSEELCPRNPWVMVTVSRGRATWDSAFLVVEVGLEGFCP